MKKRCAAVDYGLKRIGLAISDEMGRIALPLKLVDAGRSLEESARNVLKALAPYLPQLEKIVIGLPLLMSGAKGEMAERVERFAKTMQMLTEIPIEYMDERLTSAQAERALQELQYNRRARSKAVDSTSAVLLLQAFLDRI